MPGLDAEHRAISVRNLLTMTSGLPWKEIGSVEQDYGSWVSSPDQLRWILARPLDHQPGEYWRYNTGASHVLSAILTEATGASAREFAQEHLFGPLDSSIAGWPTDSRGYNYGGHGISLSGRALLKVGQLFLDRGAYNGRQIVPANWIAESVAAHCSTGGALGWDSGYGYLWWTGRDHGNVGDFYFAVGYGGQFIVNVPARNTTIVAATAWENLLGSTANADFELVLSTIVETLFPALL